MTWHGNHQMEEGSMCHPSNAEAWRHFDRTYPDFAWPRNVRLGLCTDGFTPYGQYGHTYSCWPVILTPYNFPLGMCISSEYKFLTMVISSPSNPKRLVDVYLEPLIEELQNFVACGCIDAQQCEERNIHDAHRIDVDSERPTRLWNGFWMEYRWCYRVFSL
ncbi:UNVERIFIED_CONTAM: hypothetical protein Slati_4513200 [Sesamum latifolium]|uniref:Uncharacterized protein n=1 Tax=Sesamum latifolium TaxID=2727402 RepID=A0AAW2SSM5_9LAMI